MSEAPGEFPFPGKVAVVTGAASGIGLGVATALAAEGVSVVMADVDVDGLCEQRENLSSVGRVDAPVGVSVLMPGGVRTGMNPIGDVGPDSVARNVVDAIRWNRPYVYTDDQGHDLVDERFARLRAARDDVLVEGEPA